MSNCVCDNVSTSWMSLTSPQEAPTKRLTSSGFGTILLALMTEHILQSNSEDGNVGQYRKHVLICTYGPYCGFDGDTEGLLVRLKQRVADAGLTEDVRINRAGCLNQCGHGPNVVVYPDDVWYCGVQAADADELFEEHILAGRPVDRLRSSLPPGNNKDTGRYPPEVQTYKQVEKRLDAMRSEEQAKAKAAIRLRQNDPGE